MRSSRLSTKADFQHLFTKGRRYHTGELTLIVIADAKSTTALRCAVVVATSVTKRATLRNTLRRRLREHVRLLLPMIRKGNDIVLLVRPKALHCTRKQLRATLEVLLRRSALLPPYTP